MKRVKKNIFASYILSIVCLLSVILYGCEAESIKTTETKSTTQKEVVTGEIKETTTEESTTEETTTEKSTTEETTTEETTTEETTEQETTVELSDIPKYSGSSYVSINENIPFFTDVELTTSGYEFYSELDNLRRCGVVYACIGKETMPVEERGKIGQVKPSGWHSVKYDNVDGKYLYNRCHLIGFQLTGENANERNLITGTRSMNVDGMLPFENMVADYVKETENHVMYRVTPMYENDNLLASGVLMEAKSVEDNGEGILFNVFVYNAQKGIEIDYRDGSSKLIEDISTKESTTKKETTTKEETTEKQTTEPPTTEPQTTANVYVSYVWISETGSKYHSINNCGRMNPNKAYQLAKDVALSYGYTPCSKCY